MTACFCTSLDPASLQDPDTFHGRPDDTPRSASASKRGTSPPIRPLDPPPYVVRRAVLVVQNEPPSGRYVRPETGLATWQVRRILDLLASDLRADLKLADLAREVRLSPFHFARAFKVSTGLPPHRYHINLRIERAKILLTTTDLPIIEVAASVGYDDPSYFSRLFGRALGTSPSFYRRGRRV